MDFRLLIFFSALVGLGAAIAKNALSPPGSPRRIPDSLIFTAGFVAGGLLTKFSNWLQVLVGAAICLVSWGVYRVARQLAASG